MECPITEEFDFEMQLRFVMHMLNNFGNCTETCSLLQAIYY